MTHTVKTSWEPFPGFMSHGHPLGGCMAAPGLGRPRCQVAPSTNIHDGFPTISRGEGVGPCQSRFSGLVGAHNSGGVLSTCCKQCSFTRLLCLRIRSHDTQNHNWEYLRGPPW